MPLRSILAFNWGGERSLWRGESCPWGGESSPFSELCWCLGASWGQDGPKTSLGTSQDRFFLILEPNLVDFGAQLGGCFLILEPNLVDFGAQLDGFWDPTWWILGLLG